MRLRALLFASCVLLLPPLVFGQTVNVTTGSVNGTITDSTGGVLPGVTVTATNLDTGLSRTAVSESSGGYLINLLPPGHYRVDAELSGLGKASNASVAVLLGNATKTDLKIAPQVAESVTVSATLPTVDTTRTGTAASVTNDQIENLPVLGRDFKSLAYLTPGIVDAFGGRITANGARGLATDYNIDGATSNNDFFGENTGGTRAPFTFSQAAIREFQVVRSQYDAEYGRGVGAQINAITKSGTNMVSGEAFVFYRNSACLIGGSDGFMCTGARATTLANGQIVVDSFKAKDSTQGGFAVGGPIVPNKVFFFGNYDSQHQKLPITITNDVRLSTGYKALSATDQAAFIGKLEGFLGHPYDQELLYDQTFNQNTYFGKVDANLGPTSHLSIRDNYTNFENGNNQSLGHLSNQGTEHDKFNQLVGQLNTVFQKRYVNELLVEYADDTRPVDPFTTGSEISINLTSTTPFFGQNDFLPNNTTEKKTQVRDSLQFSMGAHNLKVGTDLLFMHIDNLFPRNIGGVYGYSSAANYLNNTPNTYSQGYGPGGGLTSWNQNTYAFFVTDNVRVGSKLTLDLGLRYDWQTMPVPAANAFPQHPEFITNIKEDRNNVAPRGGFAYDLSGDGKSVIRGGAGLFYGYMPDILLSNPLTQISGNFNQVSISCTSSTITIKCPAFPNLLTTDQFNSLAAVSTNIVTVSPDYQAQQAWRSSVQYERELGRGYSAGIGVIYSKMTNVQGSRNINAVPTGTVLGDVPLYDVSTNNPNRLYTDMGVVRELCSCEEASYKGLTLETHRLALDGSQLSWDLSYTFSSSIDQDTNERSTSTSFLFDPLNPALSQGPSDNDVRHRVVGDATYHLPWDFMVSTIVQWRTGVPYNPGISFSQTGVSGSPQSLNGLSQQTGNIPIFVDSSGSVIDLTQASGFNRQQFSDFLASKGAHISGRNAYREPNWHTVDFRLAKDFRFARNTRVQLLLEVFNLFNSVDELVGASNQNLYKATLTQASGQTAAAAKYTFVNATATTANPAGSFGLTSSFASPPDPRQFQVAAKFFF